MSKLRRVVMVRRDGVPNPEGVLKEGMSGSWVRIQKRPKARYEDDWLIVGREIRTLIFRQSSPPLLALSSAILCPHPPPRMPLGVSREMSATAPPASVSANVFRLVDAFRLT